MKVWKFTLKFEKSGINLECTFCVKADTYHDATILADAYAKDMFPDSLKDDLATIKFEGFGLEEAE